MSSLALGEPKQPSYQEQRGHQHGPALHQLNALSNFSATAASALTMTITSYDMPSFPFPAGKSTTFG